MKYLAALFMLLLTGPTFAQGVRVQGAGNYSCGKYLELRAAQNHVQDEVFVSWIWGYISGFNMEVQQPTTHDGPDEASTLAYVDRYCRENPLHNVISATVALISELGGKRNPR